MQLSPKNGLEPLRTRRSPPRTAPWGSRPKHQTSFLSVLCRIIDSEAESNQEAVLSKPLGKQSLFKAQMQKCIELQSFVDSGNAEFNFDCSERCRLWLGQAAGTDELCQDVKQIQCIETRFRGQVSLSVYPPEAPLGICQQSVCSLTDTHFILLGGSEWDTELIKLSVKNSDLLFGAYGEKCFTLKIKSSLIFISVISQEARHKWLSALSEKGMAVVRWDSPLRHCQPSGSLACTRPGLSLKLKRTLNLVVWLS